MWRSMEDTIKSKKKERMGGITIVQTYLVACETGS